MFLQGWISRSCVSYRAKGLAEEKLTCWNIVLSGLSNPNPVMSIIFWCMHAIHQQLVCSCPHAEVLAHTRDGRCEPAAQRTLRCSADTGWTTCDQHVTCTFGP